MTKLPLMLMLIGGGAVYLLSQQTSKISYTPTAKIFQYDCKSLTIYNPTAFEKFKNESVKKAFEKLGVSINTIFSFKDYLFSYTKNYISFFTNKKCELQLLDDRLLYYILISESISKLINLRQNNTEQDLEKWEDVLHHYYDILLSYLDLAGYELEINQIREKLYTNGKWP